MHAVIVLAPLAALAMFSLAGSALGQADDDAVLFKEDGKASYYGGQFHGRPTASGEPVPLLQAARVEQLAPVRIAPAGGADPHRRVGGWGMLQGSAGHHDPTNAGIDGSDSTQAKTRTNA